MPGPCGFAPPSATGIGGGGGSGALQAPAWESLAGPMTPAKSPPLTIGTSSQDDDDFDFSTPLRCESGVSECLPSCRPFPDLPFRALSAPTNAYFPLNDASGWSCVLQLLHSPPRAAVPDFATSRPLPPGRSPTTSCTPRSSTRSTTAASRRRPRRTSAARSRSRFRAVTATRATTCRPTRARPSPSPSPWRPSSRATRPRTTTSSRTAGRRLSPPPPTPPAARPVDRSRRP